MSAMSTPAHTPTRLYIPSKLRSNDLSSSSSYPTWETPHSAVDRRRPSLTFSALSEPSASSLPTTPGYGGSQTGDSFSSSYHFEDGNNSIRMMHAMKGAYAPLHPSHAITFASFNSSPGYDPKQQSTISLSTEPEPFNNVSFSSNTTMDSWDQPFPHPAMQHFAQPGSFRPAQLQPVPNFQEHDELSRSMYTDTSSQHLHQNLQACQPGASLDSMSTDFLSPNQLIIPSETHDHGVYSYPQHSDSNLASPTDTQGLPSGRFDSFSSFSSWSQLGSSSPIDEYSLQDETGMPMRMKDESPLPVGPSLHDDMLQESPRCLRRSRHRDRASISKRGRAITHQLVKNVADVDVAIDPKTMEMDVKTGIISKKKVNLETKRWKCSEPGCQSRSARKEHLRRHELSHLPNKQFHCNLHKCGRAITRSDNLIQHLMTHARPPKPGKRNNHHSRRRIEQMVRETMTDRKLAERTITNLGKAIEREQEKWPALETDVEWNNDIDDDTVACLSYDA